MPKVKYVRTAYFASKDVNFLLKRGILQSGAGENVRTTISTQTGPTFFFSFAYLYLLRKILGKVRGKEVKYGTLLQTQGLFEGEVKSQGKTCEISFKGANP